jgi:hypothetical protein
MGQIEFWIIPIPARSSRRKKFFLSHDNSIRTSIDDNIIRDCRSWCTLVPFRLCTLVSKTTNPLSFTEADILLDTEWIKSCKEHIKAMITKVPIQESQSPPYSRNMRMPYGYQMLELTSRTVSRLEKSYERFLYITAKHQSDSQLIPSTYAVSLYFCPCKNDLLLWFRLTSFGMHTCRNPWNTLTIVYVSPALWLIRSHGHRSTKSLCHK